MPRAMTARHVNPRHINPIVKLVLEVGPIAVFFLAYRMAPLPEGLGDAERQLQQMLFATGVFVYRSGALLSAQDHQRYHTVGPATLAQSLDAEPPAAIIVGYQSTPRPFPIVLDPDLRDYAESRGYRLLHSPLGAAELYVNPAAQPVDSPAPPP